METKGRNNNPNQKPQTEQRHPDDWQRDLNPDYMAGQNIGAASDREEQGLPSAYDFKNLHRAFSGLRDDELKQIPVLPVGSRLQQGATYIDLSEGTPKEFRAIGDVIADRGNFFVPKDQVPYPIWNRLIGEEKPGQATDDNRTSVPPR